MSKSLGSIPLFKIKVEEKGQIKDIKEIIVRIDGLPSCLNGQIIDMGDGVKGIIMGYDEDDVLALVLGDPGKLKMGKEIKGISEPFEISVSNSLVGRMIGAMGEPYDQGGEIESEHHVPVFKDSPPITLRSPIDSFIPTGTKIIDMLIPVAKGQRQLILGDRMTGKTVIGLDAILSQKGQNVLCIYCAIGKSLANLTKAISILREHDALDYTTLIVATDNSPVGEQYIVPYSAAAVAEFYAAQDRDVLMVIDDLTKHAWAYRQLSLLLERPPGREAYPGDIFYVQTQLMERAGKFSEDHGGGSITFLGIAETLQGDLTGYIPSNLASMCDGQICLSSNIFAEGIRPAVDANVSLTIVGGKVQPPVLKHLARTLRADYAKYNEVLKLSKLSSGLSGEAERIVKKGAAIQSVFQQLEYNPVTLQEDVILLYAVEKGLLVDMEEGDRIRFCKEIFSYAKQNHADLVESIDVHTELTDELSDALAALMTDYFGQFDAGAGGAEEPSSEEQ
ncbi:F0F1 ATP synthase subunit alpha [bacterium E08(2017)]|nr:F0F1 ATP synthase subunit alpha [bacterium E08(2017)]